MIFSNHQKKELRSRLGLSQLAYCLPSPGASADYLKVTKALKLPDKRTWQSRDYALGKGVPLSHVLLEPPHEPLDVLPLSELEDPQVERLRALDCVALVVLGLGRVEAVVHPRRCGRRRHHRRTRRGRLGRRHRSTDSARREST